MFKEEYWEAEIGEMTCMGVIKTSFPVHFGNRFAINCHNCLNMFAENFEYCIDNFLTDGKVLVKVFPDYKCMIIDERIPKEFFHERYSI